MKNLLKKVNENMFRRHKKYWFFLILFFFLNIGCLTSNVQATYVALNEKIERMCEFFDIFLTKLTLAGYAPSTVLLTLINYFVFDFGADSFYLPTPMLYVFVYWESSLCIRSILFWVPSNTVEFPLGSWRNH